MTRVQSVGIEKASDEVKVIFDGLTKTLGMLPNIHKNMGNSPAVLEGYLALTQAANKTILSPKLREQIALVVGQTNKCSYCLSAHSAIAKNLGLDSDEILDARKAKATNPKDEAILNFSKIVVEERGNVSNQDVANLKSIGITDREIIETILVITLNLFTNYFNHITDPDIDFPKAPDLT